MVRSKARLIDRRAVLTGASAAAAGLALGGCDPSGETVKVDESAVAQCEKLLDLAYTDDERAQIVASLDDQLEAVRAIRDIEFDNSLAPATVFDPRLPGITFSPQSGGVTNAITATATPGNAEDAAFAPVSQQAHWIATKQISSRELTGLYLDRIARYQPLLLNFVTLTEDHALRQAARADEETAAGVNRGPLHGIPYGLKDLVDTAGIRTTWGAAPYKERVAERNARIVAMLEAAGAVLLGKTTNGAIAYGDQWFGGTTRNPWNPREGSSGSSAGSASATAAGLCSFSVGTETLGSIVSPSSRCGATGLRPTFGRVPRTGAMALCWSLDKIGPICRSASDTALVLAAINGSDAGDPAAIDHGFSWDADAPAGRMRVGYAPAWFEQGSDVDRKALETARGLGVELVEINLPQWPYNALLPQLEAEAAAAFQELTLSNLDDEMVWQDKRAWPNSWRRIHLFSAVDLIQIDRFRRRVMAMMAETMAGLDAILSPNFAGGLLIVTNYTGHPCLTLRAGFTEEPTRTLFDNPKADDPERRFTVPKNVTLWGPLFEERKLLTLGAAMEAALNVAGRRPPLERWMEELGGAV